MRAISLALSALSGLCTLDDRDLKIEQVRWASEREQFDNHLREAMANHDMTTVQVIGAQLRQSQAQYALVSEKIERAQLKAHFDSVVVSGDLSQQTNRLASGDRQETV